MTAEIQMPQQHIAIISHSGLTDSGDKTGIYTQGTRKMQATTDCFYFIDKGRVRLTYTNAAGEDHVVMFFGKGCIFNETSVITGDEATMACFRVLERTEAYRFPSSLIHDAEFARQYPHLILNMLRGTATKFSNLFSVSFLIKHGTPLARVCRFLRQLSRSHNNAKAFPLDMTQLELASVLDIHRVSLFRCLQQLRELGILVRFSRHEIELSELDQLEKLLEEQEEAEWG